ncbi:CatB-related O-acetyltransferase [Xanthobacter sp. TB0139]|uniref:CatB-related O-acetyltransferase n=1 Tax=Xanthobacter sp. TB0139 TaxID=3459178 RepID=UPI0040394EE9
MKFATSKTLSSDDIDALRNSRIGFNSAVPKAGDTISIAGEPVEPYTLHPPRTILSMGAFSYSDGFTGRLMASRVRIGRYCSIAAGARTITTQHPADWVSSHPFQYSKSRYLDREFFDLPEDYFPSCSYDALPAPVTIGNDVWIGMSATIMGGVAIGDGAIVAANALVTKDVEPYTIVGGVPARVIKRRFDECLSAEMRGLQWWNYHYRDLAGIDFSNPSKAVEQLRSRVPHIEPLGAVAVDVRNLIA